MASVAAEEADLGTGSTVGTVSAFAVLMAGITALFDLIYLEPGSFSPQKKPGVATGIETRSSISEQYPSANGLRQNDEVGPNHLNPILEKKCDAMAASERKMMM